jgi:hypothetical protein
LSLRLAPVAFAISETSHEHRTAQDAVGICRTAALRAPKLLASQHDHDEVHETATMEGAKISYWVPTNRYVPQPVGACLQV